MATSCDLGGLFDVSVRSTVIVSCSCTLLFKKCNEGPERRWDDFFLDASKQVLGACWARLLGQMVLDPDVAGCEVRWLRSVLNASLGVAVELVLLNLAASVLEATTGNSGDFASGEYRDFAGNFIPAMYSKQLGVWLTCVLFAQSFVAWLLVAFSDRLQELAEVLLAVVSWSPGLEIAMVSVFTPCFAGMVQVWLTDDFLRAGGLPLSEVFSTLGARVWPAVRQLPSLVQQADWGRRPLLRPGSGEPGARAGEEGAADLESTSAAEDRGRQKGPRAGTGAASPGAGAFGGRGAGPSPSHAKIPSPLEEETPKQEAAQFPELRAALEGMEQHIARALGSSPHVEDVTMPVYVPPATFLPRLSPSFSSPGEAPRDDGALFMSRERRELEELRIRIYEKDLKLQNMRDELSRTAGSGGSGGSGAGSPVSHGSSPGSALFQSGRSPARGGRDRIVAVGSSGSRERLLASGAVERSATSRSSDAAQGATAGAPWGRNTAGLDRKISSLEAKMAKMSSLGSRTGRSPARDTRSPRVPGERIIDHFLGDDGRPPRRSLF